jgi:hypothetical protein
MKRIKNIVSKTTKIVAKMLKPKSVFSTYQKLKNEVTKNIFSKSPATFVKGGESRKRKKTRRTPASTLVILFLEIEKSDGRNRFINFRIFAVLERRI